MEFFKRNALIVGLIVVILFGLGGFFVWSSYRNKPPAPKGAEEELVNATPMKPSEIGLDLSFRADKHAVIIKATKIDGAKSFEYELTYDAEVLEGKEKIVVPRGVVGSLNIRGGVAQAEAYLGTCSANVCKPDKVVSSIKVVIKVIFENGKIGSVEDTISLSE